MSVKNNLNPWESVPTQAPTVLPRKKQDTNLGKFHEHQPGASAPRQGQTATNDFNKWFQSFQPRDRAPSQTMKNHFINQWAQGQRQRNPAPSETFTAFPNPHQVLEVLPQPIEIQDQSKRAASATPSYAKTILPDVATPAKGKKRQLPASSEDTDASRSKKQRTKANDVLTTVDVNAPYPHHIPLYVYKGPFSEIPAPIPAFSVTTTQESTISPETTVVPEEFTFDSNVTSETNQSEGSSAPSSPLNSSEVIKGFEFPECTEEEIAILWNSENTNIDWSDWNPNLNK